MPVNIEITSPASMYKHSKRSVINSFFTGFKLIRQFIITLINYLTFSKYNNVSGDKT